MNPDFVVLNFTRIICEGVDVAGMSGGGGAHSWEPDTWTVENTKFDKRSCLGSWTCNMRMMG